MATNLEIEYKTLLTKTEYDKLSEKYKSHPIFEQTNYYFDTPNYALKSHKMSLRIRILNQKAEITLKIPQEVGNKEYNIKLSLEEANNIIQTNNFPSNDITKILNQENITLNDIKCFGHLTTKRREVKLPIGLLAIDFNEYSNVTDFELELEVSDSNQGKKDFNQFLINENIQFKYSKSKVARFSQTLLK